VFTRRPNVVARQSVTRCNADIGVGISGASPDHVDCLPDPIKADSNGLASDVFGADAVTMEQQLKALRAQVAGHVDGRQRDTIIPGVALGFATEPSVPVSTVYEPMICLVLQGAKQVMIGDKTLRYDPACCFTASLEIPASGRIIEATLAKPFIATSLVLDRDALASLIAEMPDAPEGQTAGFAVGPVTPELLSAWIHLFDLLKTPHDIAMLVASRKREIFYRLLQGQQGGLLRQIVRADSRLSQVRRAVMWIRTHYDEMLRTETLAEIAGMSVPSFHRHFKAATAMTPLQYQKTLRLQAARRMMIKKPDAAHTAYSVGYESASQFSREYARMFGVSPLRDVERMRTPVLASS
jgi:AraC-like DNA-binding protein